MTVALNLGGRTRRSWTYAGRHRQAVNRVLPFLLYILPLMIIFVVVVGSIFFKIAAPTEAAALGCLAALAACYFFRLFRAPSPSPASKAPTSTGGRSPSR